MRLIAERLDRISPSQTIAMRQRAAAMKRAGRDVLAVFRGAGFSHAAAYLRSSHSRHRGERDEIYRCCRHTGAAPGGGREVPARLGIEYAPEEIIVSTGGKQVIFNAMLATLDPGDEAVIPTPTWVSYPDIAALAGGRPVLVPCSAANGFRLTAEDLEAAITARTRWFILNNPCNPTGAVYTEHELRPLCDVLLRHPDVWVFTDDIYEKLAYDGVRPATIVQVEPRLQQR